MGITYRPVNVRILGGLLLIPLLAAAEAPDRPAGEIPAPEHSVRTIEGWHVHIDNRLLNGDGRAAGDQALKLLAGKLLEIEMIVPADRLRRLQEVPIWLDQSQGTLRQMQYHPSADWLTGHGFPGELEKSVHIPRAALFIDPQINHEQPWAVMHELAHAYHDRVLGFDDPRIEAAFERFHDADRYRSVRHVSGRMREHYGRTNPMEFFAELSESYFGTNDFYPFVRGELREDNPEAFALLEVIWGDSPAE